MQNITQTQAHKSASETRKARWANARLARGKGNPHYERHELPKPPRSPLAVCVDGLASRVSDKIIRAAGARRAGKLYQRVITRGKHRKVITLAGSDARPGKCWDWARQEMETEARSAIGAQIAAKPCLGCALLLRQSWPRENIRAVFGDTQKVMRRMARGAGNPIAEEIALEPAALYCNAAIIAAAIEHDAKESESNERARFQRLRVLLRALHAWREQAGRNATKGYEHARELLRRVLNGEEVSKDYAAAYDAFRVKVETGLVLMGWNDIAASRYLPASLPKTPGRLTVATV
jgi:hypothetical protein